MQNHVQKNASSVGSSRTLVSDTEYPICLRRNDEKKYHVMRFNASSSVAFEKWGSAKMERENNLREAKVNEETMPKFGAGSEYNRDLKEEARRNRLGFKAKKHKPEAQPWVLRTGGKKDGKKFRGIREGGVAQNAAYYVFSHTPNGTIEACPLQEWYNFQPIQRYKALSVEEAEEEFGRRTKILNYFNLMMKKRLKGAEEDSEEPEESNGAKKGASGDKRGLKISEMDDWIDSDDANSSDDDEESERKAKDSDDENDKKAKNKKKILDAKKKKRAVDEEAFEDSDDGDEEGREMDYISDSSDSDSELETKNNTELKSVAEEDALRKLLSSGESSDEEEEESKEGESKKEKENADKKELSSIKKTKKKKARSVKEDSSSDSDSSSSDSEGENDTNSQNKNKAFDSKSRETSKKEYNKRKLDCTTMPSNDSSAPPAKLPKIGTPKQPLPTSSHGHIVNNYGITEDTVRRYLKRKPITTTELLAKFKYKQVPSEKLIEVLTIVLQKINPTKQMVQGKLYLSIK